VITDLIRLSIEFDSSIELNSTERTKKKASLFVKQEWYHMVLNFKPKVRDI
jgi:hypothetical protein